MNREKKQIRLIDCTTLIQFFINFFFFGLKLSDRFHPFEDLSLLERECKRGVGGGERWEGVGGDGRGWWRCTVCAFGQSD